MLRRFIYAPQRDRVAFTPRKEIELLWFSISADRLGQRILRVPAEVKARDDGLVGDPAFARPRCRRFGLAEGRDADAAPLVVHLLSTIGPTAIARSIRAITVEPIDPRARWPRSDISKKLLDALIEKFYAARAVPSVVFGLWIAAPPPCADVNQIAINVRQAVRYSAIGPDRSRPLHPRRRRAIEIEQDGSPS